MSSDFVVNFLAGGVSGAVAKTCTAPIERVKLLIQTQDANPKIISGEVARYTGIVDCFSRVASEQGIGAFWRGNFTNILRYFPTQAFNFAFKDGIKAMFPKADKNTEFGKFFAINMASGGLAGAGSLMIVYPLDFARTRLASDVGGGKAQFTGLADCLKKTVAASGIGGLYNGIGVSVTGIIPYRGVYFGLFDTLSGLNPYQKDTNNFIRAGSKFLCAQTSATPEPTPEPTPNPVTPDPTPEPTPEPTPDPTPEPTPDPTPDPTPEPTPEPTPNPTEPETDPPVSPAPTDESYLRGRSDLTQSIM